MHLQYARSVPHTEPNAAMHATARGSAHTLTARYAVTRVLQHLHALTQHLQAAAAAHDGV